MCPSTRQLPPAGGPLLDDLLQVLGGLGGVNVLPSIPPEEALDVTVSLDQFSPTHFPQWCGCEVIMFFALRGKFLDDLVGETREKFASHGKMAFINTVYDYPGEFTAFPVLKGSFTVIGFH
jgi:hypothetical protein